MMKRVTWRPAAVAALLLAAGASRAGYQESNRVGWLGTGDWQLRRSNGQVYLQKSPVTRGAKHTSWAVSAPAIKTSGDKKLGYDAKGRDSKARLVSGKSDGKTAEGASTRWAFEVVEHIRPEWVEAKEGQKGPSGITFRAMAAEGPYTGWYLAAKDDGKDKKRLVLVRSRKDATVFKYVKRYYRVRPNK